MPGRGTTPLGQLAALVSYTPGDALAAATFTRATTAAYIDVNGIVNNAASGVARDAHYIGATRTYLSEPASTNILLYNTDFSQRGSAWGLDGGSNGSAGSVTGPNGVAAAGCLLVINSVSGVAHSTVGQTPASQPASPQTFSVWLRGNLGTEIVWVMSTADSITYQSTRCALTAGWKRYSVTSASATGYRFSIGRDLRDATQTAQASSANIYAWGAQVETGSVMSSTIYPTTTASVTRNADVLTIPWSSTPVAMTLYVQAIDQGLTAQADATGKVVCSVGNANNRFTISQTSTPDVSLNYRTASIDHKMSDIGSLPAFGDTIEYRATLSSGGVAAITHSTNGGTETAGATTTVTLPGAWDSANIEMAGLSGAQQGGIALIALIIVAGVKTLSQSRTASRTPIGIGPDTTPAAIVMSPNTIATTVGAADTNVTSTVTNAAGSTIVGATVTYTTSDATICTVGSSSGVVHAVAVGSAIVTATTSNGKTDTTAVTVSPAPASARTLRYPNIRHRINAKALTNNQSADITFINANYDDVYTGSKGLLSFPNAITSQIYSLLAKMEIDVGAVFNGSSWSASADDAKHAVMCRDYAASYATTNSQNVEDYWIHARAGDLNTVCPIASVSSGGVVAFAKERSTDPALPSSFPFTIGQTITVAGTTAGAGTYAIASLQSTGVTLTGWAAGALTAGGTVSTVGDGTSTAGNRVRQFWFSEWREHPNHGNANCRGMHAARFVQFIAATNGPWNTSVIDEMDPGQLTNGVAQSVEYGATGGSQYITDLCSTLTAILAAPSGPKYLRPNTGSYINSFAAKICNAGKGSHSEQLLGSFYYNIQDQLNYFIARIGEGNTVEYVDGYGWLDAAHNGNVTPNPGVQVLSPSPYPSYNAGNYPSVTERHQVTLLATYYLGCDTTKTAADGTTYKFGVFDTTNSAPSDSPIAARYFAAFKYNVGQPIAPYTFVSGNDSAGQGGQVLTRSFSLDGGTTLSAYMIVCGNTAGQSNYGDNSIRTVTLPAIPAGKTAWFRLMADGTLEATAFTTSVSVRRAEGLIMVPN